MAMVGENFGGILGFETRRFDASGLAKFAAGDTLFAKITPCAENGKVAYVDRLPGEIGIGSTEFIVLAPRADSDPRFLYHLLCSQPVRGRAASRMEGSTGRQRVPDDVFEKRLLVPVPPPAEQAAIARILDAVDAAIARTRAAAERARGFRQSLIHELLRKGTRGEAQRKSGIGLLPASWECTPFGSCIADGPTNGVYLPESDYGASGIPIVRIDSFDDGHIHGMGSLRRVKVPAAVQRRYELRCGDLLINRVNSLSHIGKASIVPPLGEATIFESNMMRIRCADAILPDYLILVLSSDIARRHWLARAKSAVNQASINQRDVRSLLVPIPPKPEQEAIAALVSTQRSHLSALRAKLTALATLKRSLMHDLLTGRVRVGT
jgi:type I restriction enzyme S subunit